jgi:uncharacterized protein
VIFVDTSFWVALRNRRDGNHSAAEQLLKQRAGIPMLTTNHVRGETWTYLRRRAGHRAAVDFLEVVERSPRIRITHVGEDLEAEALRWLRRRDDRKYSFVDATSFALMRSLRISEALTFDQDFAAAGFVVAS